MDFTLQSTRWTIPQYARRCSWAQVVVFALGPGSTLHHAEGLVKAVEGICRACGDEEETHNEMSYPAQQDDIQLLQLGVKCMQKEPQIAMKPREAAFSPTQR